MENQEFRDVTRLLAKAYSQGMIAAYLGVGVRTYQAYRAQEGQRHYRRPPPNWKERLRPLAPMAITWYRSHADTLAAEMLRETLKPDGGE